MKLYADEPDADDVRSLSPLAISQIARVEVPAALWRKHRMGELSPAAAGVLIAEFEADYFGTKQEPERFAVVLIASEVLDSAATLAGRHRLRAYDAVQLASACALRDLIQDLVFFAAYDTDLNSAAVAEGLGVLDV
jgi:predicted nucleic acid-binding protein